MVKHLIKVAQYKEQNKMELTNLAVIFGPTLMSPPMHMMSSQLAVGMKKQTQVLEMLLDLHEQVFDDEVVNYHLYYYFNILLCQIRRLLISNGSYKIFYCF